MTTLLQWADGCDLDVLAATRGHLELYRALMEQAGRISANSAQYVRRQRLT